MISEKLARFVCSTTIDVVPKGVIEIAKRTMLDCIGVTLVGLHDSNSVTVRELVLDWGGKAESSIFGCRVKVPSVNSALANGVAAHALDYDDVNYTLMGHPSAISVPSCFAVGEPQHSSGEDVILAYIIGTEVASKLGAALTDAQYERGWHNTGTMGTFGAAASAGKLLRLNQEQMQNAIGIAASMTAGIKQNFGTSCKSYQAGQAASNGVRAALLAERGFTASPDVFEGKTGLVQLLSGSLKEGEIERLGDPYAIDKPGFSLKMYPSCAFTHSAIDCALKIRRFHSFDPSEVVEVSCTVSQGVIDTVTYGVVVTPNQGKFSMPFCLSLALLEGRVSLAQFTVEKCLDPKVMELEKKIRMYRDPRAERYTYNGARVEVKLGDGRKFIEETRSPVGEPAQTLSDAQLLEKYVGCATTALSNESSDFVARTVLNLEKLPDVSDLASVLAG